MTVAVLDSTYSAEDKYFQRDLRYYKFEPFKSTGAGGQHRNKTMSGIKCIHLPTGVKQERTTKCQHSNKREALAAVNRILDEMAQEEARGSRNDKRVAGVGSGMRGDKIRTYQFQRDLVTDHNSGKTASCKRILRGNMDIFWE